MAQATHPTIAIPHSPDDLEERLKALHHVKPDTVTVLQQFLRCHGGRAQVLRVVRQRPGVQRRFLLTNRKSYKELWRV